MRRFRVLTAALLTTLSLVTGAAALRAAGTDSAPAPPAPPATPADPATLALNVFKRRCVDCHGKKAGPDFVKFNYIEDLAKLSANKKFITAGDPDKSKLYQYVARTKKPYMPAKREPLTPDELAAVKAWIVSLPVAQK